MRRFLALLAPVACMTTAAWLLCCGGDDAAQPGPSTTNGSSSSGGTSGGGTSGTDATIPDPVPADDAGPSVPKAPYDWVGVVGTGQSLSVGAAAAVLVSTKPSFNNLKLNDTGPNPKYPIDAGGDADRFAVAPLVEAPRNGLAGYDDSQYPNNIAGETPHSGMASELTHLFTGRGGADYVSVHSVVGWSGHALVDIDKEGTGRAYPGSLFEARTFAALAKKAGKTFGYGAVVLTHGEADRDNPDYGKGLKTFIDDYNTDLKAITGQADDVFLLVSQQSTAATAASSAVQVWQAGVDNPRIVCTGPKYQFGYAADNLHMPAPGYRRLGEKYAEVFDLVVNQKKPWKPLQPKAVTRSGDKVVIVFDVPNPPLQWDDTLAPPHQKTLTEWAKGRGFEIRFNAMRGTITAADITAPDTVTLTVANPPAGALTVSYATVQDGTGFQGGLVSGYRGQLRDSDELIGFDEESIDVQVTNGSDEATVTAAPTLAGRALRDVVTGDGVPPGWTVLAMLDPKTLKMSAPWTGMTAIKTVKIHHDLHNYAVHFARTNIKP